MAAGYYGVHSSEIVQQYLHRTIPAPIQFNRGRPQNMLELQQMQCCSGRGTGRGRGRGGRGGRPNGGRQGRGGRS